MTKLLTSKKVIAIHTFRLNIPKNTKLDLWRGVSKCQKEYNMRYNPEAGISGVHFQAFGKSFLLYANCSLCAYGNYTQKEKETAFKRFWSQNKAFFLNFEDSSIHI